MKEHVEESDIDQSEPCATPILAKEGIGTFGRVRWSAMHCLIALGSIAGFQVAFYLLGLWLHGSTLYAVGIGLWILMVLWMALIPLWIAHSQKVLRRPKVRRIVKELALAIPVTVGLIVVERLVITFLSHVSGSVVETNPTLSRLRGAPGDVRVYLMLITVFALGPLAEELFFRGLVYSALRRWIGSLAAVVLQSFIFMLAHYKMPETGIAPMAAVFFAGLVLAGIYEWRKTLWGPVAVHVLINLAFVVPVAALMILNSHTPSETWQEAELPPDWLGADLADIEKKASGEEQRLHAIDTWGTEGKRLWKEEIRGLRAVCEWFPDDRAACAQARLETVHVYLYYLRDLRRAVVQSDRILSEFKEQSEACAQALLMKGQSYRELGDREMSEQCLREVLESYPSPEWVQQAALEELGLLDTR
ncbi:MAG: CPBP family glutamic-type intramembrane protease, partial [Planctomycetota bacterium]